MQYRKSINKFSETEAFANDSEMLTSSMSEFIGKFKLKSHLAPFDGLKSKGLPISSVYAFIRNGIKESDIQGKKDVYYDVKNNEFIDWRSFLMLHATRLQYLLSRNQSTVIQGIRALIFDDSFLAKTGIKAEKVSRTFDHVSGQWIFGYKLLACGIWDGGSFIPLNYSFHREKRKANEDLIQAFRKAKRTYYLPAKL